MRMNAYRGNASNVSLTLYFITIVTELSQHLKYACPQMSVFNV